MDDATKVPENEVAMWGVELTKAALSVVPVFGGPAAELFGAILQPQLEKRKTAWLESLARELVRLGEHVHGLTPEVFAHSPAFASAFLQASSAAIRTHLQEKLDALRNAVLNIAAGTAPDDNLQLTFIRYVDELTPWHLSLLDAVADPLAWAAKRNHPVHAKDIRADNMFEGYFRNELPKGHEKVLLQDLYVRGLATSTVDPYGPLYPRDVHEIYPRITDLGRTLLTFIETPPLLAGETEVNGARASTSKDHVSADTQ